ncbi:hypothetical protein BGZ96_008751 [Linnemannia gamsii]|uniref:HCP-like protein n=1 Tax=Linnemannia gamsii TaxID=64522 RepID=A0ABQ7KDW5_9FUNG|nr:hypothetical protein BGZ96_008751 [Linnemannia gamsii]
MPAASSNPPKSSSADLASNLINDLFTKHYFHYLLETAMYVPLTSQVEDGARLARRVVDRWATSTKTGNPNSTPELVGVGLYVAGINRSAYDAPTYPMPVSPQYAAANSAVRRNPVWGLEEAAMDNYSHIDSASNGDKDAQVALGDMFMNGNVVKQEYISAMDWYLKATNQGGAVGQRKVGLMHNLRLGVPQDYSVAMDWYLKAANQGDANAQCNIGILYDQGLGVPQDYSQAMNWFLKAAD